MNLIYYSSFERYGGIENYGYNLISYFKKNHPEINIIVVTPTKNNIFKSYFLSKGIKVFELPNFIKSPIKYKKVLRNILNMYKNNSIIQLNICTYKNTLLFKEVQKSKIKTIIIGHFSKSAGPLKLLHFINRRRFKQLGFKIAVSDRAKNFTFGKKSVCRILYNGIDSAKFSFSEKSRESIRNQLGLTNKDVLFAQIGRISKEKNFKFSIKLFSILCQKYQNCRLVLVGPGNKKKLYSLARKNKVLDKTIFLELEPELTRSFYSAVDIHLIPSLHESFSLVLVEGLCSSLVTFASNNIPFIFSKSDAVQILPLNANVWLEAIKNKIGFVNTLNRKSNLIENTDFDLKNSLEKYFEVYNLLDKHK